MTSVSLLKIPFLVVIAINIHISLTTPHKPSTEESAKYRDPIAVSYSLFFISIAKFIMYLCVASESALILLLHLGNHDPYSHSIIHIMDHSPNPSYGSPALMPTFMAAFILSTAATLVRLACYKYLGRLFTFELAIREDHILVTTGPYSIVRHPAYTAAIVQSMSVLVCLFGPGSWMHECGWIGGGMLSIFDSKSGTWLGRVFLGFLIAQGCYVGWMMVLRTTVEDTVLKNTFGKEWDIWAGQVKYRLIPGCF